MTTLTAQDKALGLKRNEAGGLTFPISNIGIESRHPLFGVGTFSDYWRKDDTLPAIHWECDHRLRDYGGGHKCKRTAHYVITEEYQGTSYDSPTVTMVCEEHLEKELTRYIADTDTVERDKDGLLIVKANGVSILRMVESLIELSEVKI